MSRQTRLQINLAALRDNFRLAAKKAPTSQTLAVIKADAYGHGMAPVAQALETEAAAFAVATIDEGLTLRQLTTKPILVLEGVYRPDELAEATHHKLTLMVHDQSQVELICETTMHQAVALWLKADTGMHRLGLAPADVPAVYSRLKALSWVQPDLVVSSHFANASEPEHPYNDLQWQQFEQLMQQLPDGTKFSMANSAALLSRPASRLDWNRPGIMLYGGAPFDDIDHPLAEALMPVMSFISEVIAVRDIKAGEPVGYGSGWTAMNATTIATIAAGYADGYPRHAPPGTPVLINGQQCSLAGRVSMDMITVDVTDRQVTVGDQAELWGQNISINQIAEQAGTISYSLMTAVSQRVPRIYQN